MKRVFKTRMFSRWMRKVALSDKTLCEAVREMQNGLVDADLGGHVFKKRVPLSGRGKRSGARTLVATNKGSRWFFIYGFEKNERANISQEELEALRELANDLLASSDAQLNAAVVNNSLGEICHETRH